MSALQRLSPQLRHGITDVLGWTGLRPVQEASIPPLLAGENLVILAPTAGGKTEAAMLPALDVMLREGQRGVGLLYISPLVALLNNQEARAETLAGLLGMRAFKWHGGVTQGARKQFLEDPAEILLTTPESLEAMLIGRRVPVAQVFAGLRFAVIDEVHAFAASDRGAHLMGVLERLAAFSEHDVQRVGLSATVLNPAEIGRWIKGRSQRRGRVVRPSSEALTRQVQILAFAKDDTSARAQLHRQVLSGKSLIFTESRVDAEQIASELHRSGQLEFVGTYHSAISLEARRQAEDAMNGSEYRSVCLACTSAMELGIDIGDLDRVVQWGPPSSVSSLLQRWGRTGRRAGRVQYTSIYTQSAAETLTALAEVSLAQEGWSEPVYPQTRAYHILFQQMLNRVLQSGGLSAADLWTQLQGISAFRGIGPQDYEELTAHLLRTGMLSGVSGILVLGDLAEKRLGAKRFQALITSFDTPDVYTVKDVSNHYEVGQLESWFVDELRQAMEGGETPVILLTGRAWQVLRLHQVSAAVDVRPDTSGQPPKWLSGTPRLMDERLAWRHRELLISEEGAEWLNAAGQAQLTALRSDHQFLRSRRLAWHRVGRRLTLFTYAGTRINKTLELLLRTVAVKAASNNFEIQLDLADGQPNGDVSGVLVRARDGVPVLERHELSTTLHPLRLSKYQPYLPEWMGQSVVADHLLDFDGTQRYLLEKLGGDVELS